MNHLRRIIYIFIFQVTADLGMMGAALAQTNSQDQLACLQEEAAQVSRNKARMDQLFWTAMEKYKDAQPCVGVGARNIHGPGFSVCGKSSPHFVLSVLQPELLAIDAKLREGAVLVSINGAPVRYHLDFDVQVLAATPGTKVTLSTERDGKRLEHQVDVGLMRVTPKAPPQCVIAK